MFNFHCDIAVLTFVQVNKFFFIALDLYVLEWCCGVVLSYLATAV